MSARIFTRDVGGFRAGEVRDLDWSSIHASLVQHHGVTESSDAYSLPVEEAAQRYVASLQVKEVAAKRPRASDAAA